MAMDQLERDRKRLTPPPTIEAVSGATGGQVPPEIVDCRVLNLQALGVKHGLAKAGATERIAEIVHIDKVGDMRLVIDRLPGFAQFTKRIRPERREQEHPIRFQKAKRFDQKTDRRREPQRRQGGDHQVGDIIGKP